MNKKLKICQDQEIAVIYSIEEILKLVYRKTANYQQATKKQNYKIFRPHYLIKTTPLVRLHSYMTPVFIEINF